MSNLLPNRRLGRFEIDLEVIHDHPDIVRTLLAGCIVLEATNSFASAKIEYLALNDAFDEVPDGVVTPSYDMEYNGDTGEVTWTERGA